MIVIEKLTKNFAETPVLRDLSLTIEGGDFVAVMGPSGSGKSTLLYSVSGMDQISSGRVLFEGRELYGMKERELAQFRLTKMGFVFQYPQMLKNLSVLDNIVLPGLVARQEPAAVIRDRGLALMEEMGIASLKDRDVREVSGGQLQRASICRGLINLPRVLFLDEPTGALNSQVADQVLEILGRLHQRGMTILLVTHDPRVAARAGRVIYLKDGILVASTEFAAGDNREIQLGQWLMEQGSDAPNSLAGALN
jgi:putative ABC transport system ATP-binding protein